MYLLIKKLNHQEGITVIMISHDIDTAIRNASHILHIGKMIFFGTKQEYLKSEISKVFINMEGGTVK
jgi:zinc transport system ATP-binding protein